MAEPEVWLRGPLDGYHPLVMPVAHSLLQVREDLARRERSVTASQLWARPGGAASIGFHIRHTGGALDRLLTYARGDALAAPQLVFLAGEEAPGDPPGPRTAAVDRARPPRARGGALDAAHGAGHHHRAHP